MDDGTIFGTAPEKSDVSRESCRHLMMTYMPKGVQRMARYVLAAVLFC